MPFFKTLLFLFCIFSSQAYAQQTVSPTEVSRWRANIEEERSPENPGITFLTWDDTKVWVEEDNDLQYTILKGHVSKPINQLNLNGKNVYVNDSGDFEIRFGFRGYEKTFRITILDSQNKVYRAQFRLTSPHPKASPTVAEAGTLDFSPKRFRYSFGLGLTKITYQQTGIEQFNEYAVTIKGGITYRLVPNRWDLGVSGFYNAAILHSDSIFSIRYYGLIGRVGYHFLSSASRYRFVLNGGFYYNDSASSGTIGFTNMYGPQLNPELTYLFRNGNSAMIYAKYAVALSRFNFSENREWATGAYYSFPLNPTYRMSIGIDYSNLSLSTESDMAKTSTVSLSAGLAF